MWNKSFFIIVFSSFFLSCIALWRASVGPSAERIIESVISEMNKKPEIFAKITMEGMHRLQKSQEDLDRARIAEKIRSKKRELMEDKRSPSAGNPNGNVVILAFFDYHCGYCRSAHDALEKLLTLDNRLKVVYREYPIFGDLTLSRAALAAHRQGKYKDFHTILMKSDAHFTQEGLIELARKLKLDVKKFCSDMNSLGIENMIQNNMSLGRSLDISATPTFLVGESVVSGALSVEEFQREIQKERSKQEKTTATT